MTSGTASSMSFPRPLGSPDPLDALADDPDWDGIELVEDGLPPLDLPLQRLLNGGVEAELECGVSAHEL